MGMTNCEGSYKLTVSQSGERIDTSNGEKFPLEMMKLKEKSTENLVLDNRLTLEPPDLIPKISNLNRKSSSAQDIRDNRLKYEYNHFNNNDKYRLKPVSGNNGNGRLGMFSDNILQSKCKVTFSVGNEEKPKSNYEIERIPVATVECVRAVITKLEAEAPERLEQRKENVYQSNEEEFVEKKSTTATMTAAAAAVLPKMEENDKYGVSISLSRTETENAGKEKTPTLLRVRSNIEKRLSRSDSMKSNDGKVDRSKSLKLVERSTSFDRSDTMKVVGFVRRPEERNLNLSVSDASSQTDLLEEDPARDETDRKKLEEELECERLSRDLASQLPPSDKLHSLLGKLPFSSSSSSQPKRPEVTPCRAFSSRVRQKETDRLRRRIVPLGTPLEASQTTDKFTQIDVDKFPAGGSYGQRCDTSQSVSSLPFLYPENLSNAQLR